MTDSSMKTQRPPPGAPPGTLVPHPDAGPPEIRVISYGPVPGSEGIDRQRVESIDDLPPLPPGHTVRWIDVAGLGNRDTLRRVGEIFAIHPLTLEDVLHVRQRPKVEHYDDYLFVVIRMPAVAPTGDGVDETCADGDGDTVPAMLRAQADRLVTEQVAILVGRDFVITFQERPGDVFDPIRARMEKDKGRIRSCGPDYLAYALIDAAIDSFFPLMEVYGEQVDELEQAVVAQPRQEHITQIHDIKRNLLDARRSIWPQREMLNSLIRDESALIRDDTRIFLRDCYDHAIQLIDMIETYREIASALVDVHLASVSNRMNEVMKVLTMIATIFIPLTFIAGIYGMNFDPEASPWNMPELAWTYGYPATLLFMLGIGVGLLWWFRRKGWLGGSPPR